MFLELHGFDCPIDLSACEQLVAVSLGGTNLNKIIWPKHIITFGEASCCKEFISKDCPIRFIKCDQYWDDRVDRCEGHREHTDLEKVTIDEIWDNPRDDDGKERTCCVLADSELNKDLVWNVMEIASWFAYDDEFEQNRKVEKIGQYIEITTAQDESYSYEYQIFVLCSSFFLDFLILYLCFLLYPTYAILIFYLLYYIV